MTDEMRDLETGTRAADREEEDPTPLPLKKNTSMTNRWTKTVSLCLNSHAFLSTWLRRENFFKWYIRWIFDVCIYFECLYRFWLVNLPTCQPTLGSQRTEASEIQWAAQTSEHPNTLLYTVFPLWSSHWAVVFRLILIPTTAWGKPVFSRSWTP